jgi:hypothetical protein
MAWPLVFSLLQVADSEADLKTRGFTRLSEDVDCPILYS